MFDFLKKKALEAGAQRCANCGKTAAKGISKNGKYFDAGACLKEYEEKHGKQKGETCEYC